MKQSKKQLRRRIKELEAGNKTLAEINCNLCLEMACLKSANRALQARDKANAQYSFHRYNPKTDCKESIYGPINMNNIVW